LSSESSGKPSLPRFQSIALSDREGFYLPSPEAVVLSATGSALASGRPAIATVSADPAEILQALSGLYVAWADRIPVILEIQGEVSEEILGGIRTVSRRILRGDSKDLANLRYEDFPAVVISREGEWDPTVGSAESLLSSPREDLPPEGLSLHRSEIQDLFKESQRPVLLVGGGAVRALPSILSFAQNKGIPVLLTARGTTMRVEILEELHRTPPTIPLLPSGNLVWVRTMMTADLIVCLGTALSEVDGFGLKDTHLFRGKTIHIGHPLPPPSTKLCDLTLPISVESWVALPETQKLEPDPRWEKWCKRVEGWIHRWHRILEEEANSLSKKETLDPFFVAYTLAHSLPHETIFVSEGGACGMQVWATLWLRSFLFPCQTGCIGVTLPFSLGAYRAFPGRPIVNILGDGAFFYFPEVLERIAREKCPIATFLFNDACYGAIRLGQTFFFSGRYIGTDLPSPEFARMAEALGIPAHKIERTGEFLELLPLLKNPGTPLFVDLRIPRDTLPLAGANFVLAEFDGVTRANLGSLLWGSIKAFFTGKIPFRTIRMGRRIFLP
jgi:acetolactate synthase-1/2/3 large subunit